LLNKFLSKITEKWPVKIISVAAALIIAYFYRMNSLEKRTFMVPLQIETNSVLIPASSIVNSVSISLRGEADSINTINVGDIEAYINLDKYSGEGMYRIPVQVRKKGSAAGVEPLEISVLPVEISILLEQKTRRNIPVFPLFSGELPPEYELISQSIIPETVTAEGPRSSIEKLYEFNTEKIDLVGRTGDFSVLVQIINKNLFIDIFGNRMLEYHGVIRNKKIEAAEAAAPLPDIEEEEGGQ
jgi:YbbR domain-containing protein